MNRARNLHLKKLATTSVFLAMGILLPFFFGQITQIGGMLLPMHIPVFLCAFVCGWRYATLMSAILPLLRSLLFARPNLYPEAIAIAFELAAYAFAAGFLYSRCKKRSLWEIYGCLLFSMVAGRLVRTVVQLTLLGMRGMPFSFRAFFFGVLLTGIPGIVLQLILIPAAVRVIALRTADPSNQAKQVDKA